MASFHDGALHEAQDFLLGADLVGEPGIVRIGHYAALRAAVRNGSGPEMARVEIQCDAFEPSLVEWDKLLVRYGRRGPGSLVGGEFLNSSGARTLELRTDLLDTLRATIVVRAESRREGLDPQPVVEIGAAAAEGADDAARFWHDFLWMIDSVPMQISFQRIAEVTQIASYAPGVALKGGLLKVRFQPLSGGDPVVAELALHYEETPPWALINGCDLLVTPEQGDGGCYGYWIGAVGLGEYELSHEVLAP